MAIREMTNSDIPYVQKMLADLNDLHAENEPNIFNAGVTRRQEYYKEIINNPNKIIFVAISEEGKRVGCIKGKIIDFPGKDILKARKYGYIDGIFIVKEYRGLLYEYKLQKTLFKWFLDQGINHVEANVWDFNGNAKEYYKLFGYRYTKHGLAFEIKEDK